MAVIVSPFGPKPQFFDAAGSPDLSYQLFFYAAGSNTKQNTYTDSTGASANTNPILLNSLGQPTTQIWFTEGQSYKVVLAPPSDTDPPTSPIWTIDNLRGMGTLSSAAVQDQWVLYGQAPTFISATSFSVTGNQTATFQINRRVKTVNSTGTLVYSRITNSVFGAVTTVTLANDSGSLDAGLSAVSYGLLSATNPSIPESPAGALLRVGTTGTVLQVLTFTDAGASTTSGTLASVTVSAKSITPKSSNSTILVRCVTPASIAAAGAGTNATGGFRLFNVTTSADMGSVEIPLGTTSGAGANLNTSGLITAEATLANAALTAISFILRARYTATATTVAAQGQQWMLMEIQN